MMINAAIEHTNWCEENGLPCTDWSESARILNQPRSEDVRDAKVELGDGAPWCRIVELAHQIAERITEAPCSRCRATVAVESESYTAWEQIDGREVCPNCIRGHEEQMIFDDYAEDYMFAGGGEVA